MSNILDPEQVRRFVGPDLGPSCLQRLSADDTRRQGVNAQKGGSWAVCHCKNMCKFTPKDVAAELVLSGLI